MLPSPSLGPPLLSGSWSPPLPCGIGFVVAAGAVTDGAGAAGVACAGRAWWWWCVAAGVGAAECAVAAGLAPLPYSPAPVPHPAASAAISASPAAHRAWVNMACPFRSARISDRQAEVTWRRLQLSPFARQAGPRPVGGSPGARGVLKGGARPLVAALMYGT